MRDTQFGPVSHSSAIEKKNIYLHCHPLKLIYIYA
jgi:hypothetical protein